MSHSTKETDMPGLKENLDALVAHLGKHVPMIWGQASERLRVAAIEGMRHRKDPKLFEQRGQEVDDLGQTIEWLQDLAQHSKKLPQLRPEVAPHEAKEQPTQPSPVPPNYPRAVPVTPPPPTAPTKTQTPPVQIEVAGSKEK
jgi:hypothetical protein